VKQSLLGANIKCGGTPVAYLSAACVLLELPQERVRTPWPWLPEDFRLEPQHPIALDPAELAALDVCERAEAAATAEHRFIEHFWCGIPETSNGEARLRVKVTPHLGNRMGHVQGGLLLGMAMKVANAATPAGMRLSNISSHFISPGVGHVLDVHSTISHRGRRLATVRTQITGASGKLVLEAASQHVAA
jgi:acyl-coenzyme A thioesterase PaaI-like protein